MGNMARLEAAEMRFLRSVKGYTRLDKIRREIVIKELEISGILDQPSRKNGQHQTSETRSHLQT